MTQSNNKPILTIREATQSDAAAIARIGEETFRVSFGWSLPPADLERYLETTYTAAVIAEEIADTGANRFFVAEHATSAGGSLEVGGFVQMKMGSTEPCIPTSIPACELHRIYVSKDHLGAGIGGQLIEKAIEWARAHTSMIVDANKKIDVEKAGGSEGTDDGTRPALWLGVWQENPKARRLYERHGFVNRMGEHGFTMGATTQYDDILLKWL